MTQSIYTQDDEIINYANIISLSIGVGNTSSGTEAFAVMCQTIAKEIIYIGIYDTKEEATDTFEKIKDWLSKGIGSILVIS